MSSSTSGKDRKQAGIASVRTIFGKTVSAKGLLVTHCNCGFLTFN